MASEKEGVIGVSLVSMPSALCIAVLSAVRLLENVGAVITD